MAMLTAEALWPLEASSLLPLFLGKRSSNITFLVDTSEDMRAALGSVKRLLIQTLLTKASLRDSLFNLMTFSHQIRRWSPHMLHCVPDMVYAALSWIHSISCSPGRDLVAALTVALADCSCHTLHLLTRGLPDCVDAVVRALCSLAPGRTVNIFYLLDSGKQLDSQSLCYLQSVRRATRGGCYVIPVSFEGTLEKVIPLFTAAGPSSSVSPCSPARCCWSSSTIVPNLHNTSSAVLRSSLGNPLRHARLQAGGRVLAKRPDGLYHVGTLLQEAVGRRGVWLVDFYHPEIGGVEAISSSRQPVCTLDMVSYPWAQTSHVAPGDSVLSPWEPDRKRFGPGRVMSPTECCGHVGGAATVVRVLMWNGCVSEVPLGLLVPISALHHDRIVRELHILGLGSSFGCPPAGASCSSCTPRLHCTDLWASCCGPRRNRWQDMSAHTPTGGGLATADVEKRPNAEGSDTSVRGHAAPSASSSSFSGDESTVALPMGARRRSRDARPPWRYWRRTGAEPQHRKPGTTVPRATPASLLPSASNHQNQQLPPSSPSPNHSSLFQTLPGSEGRGANLGELFGMTRFRPHPPPGVRPFASKSMSAVYG